MLRLVVTSLLAVAAVDGMIVRRQADAVCPFALLPVLNICPPCQPSNCYCADGKQLSLDDQRQAEQNRTLPCEASTENPYGLPARCDCEPPGQGFSFQDIFAQLQAAQQAAAAQQGAAAQQTEGLQQPQEVAVEQPQAAVEQPQVAVEQPQPAAEQTQEAAPAPAPAPAGSGCPHALLPILNVCPPCSPTGCFCADGRELTLEDQAKADATKTPPCAPTQENPWGLPGRCNCAEQGSGFTFQEILAILAQQQAQQAALQHSQS